MSPQELLDWVAQNGVWVYGLVFAYCLGKTGPLPLVAGFLAGSGSLSVALVGAAALAGSVGGGQLRFWMGRKGAPWLYARYPGMGRWVALGSVAVDHYSRNLLPVYRFAKGTFSLVGVGAGASTLGWSRFVALDVLGAVLWASVMVSVGYGVGRLGGVIEPEIAAYIGLSLLLLGVLAASVFGKRLKLVLQPKADAAFEQVLARGKAHAH